MIALISPNDLFRDTTFEILGFSDTDNLKHRAAFLHLTQTLTVCDILLVVDIAKYLVFHSVL